MNLRAVRSPEGALELLGLLGYDATHARPYDLADVGWSGAGLRLGGARASRGYGVLVAETPELPRSLKIFGRRLVEMFHDAPLAFVGVGEGGKWREWAVIRPRLVPGGGGAVTIAKLQVDPTTPTAHDVDVLSRLAWHLRREDAANQQAIDQALDVERVTRSFFIELNQHYKLLVSAVEDLGAREPAAAVGIEYAGGAPRVALRIVTQTLFCYFLQRKGLLDGDRAWLTHAYARARHSGGFYPRVMEPLFYEALNEPLDRRPEQWRREGIPFLNGGLFERRYGSVSLALDDALFSTEEGLLGFLDRWSFTVSEDTADETEVAVDPEMLGKVFENLIAEDDRRAQGTIYTPRPVVQFMCREALVPYLQRTITIDEMTARTLLTSDEPFGALADKAGAPRAAEVARTITRALTEIQILDPAVGSGAFLLGMLSEILRLRRMAHLAIEGQEPPDDLIGEWKLHGIERSLFGVDIDPTAIELCRLRLWLSLLVEAPSGRAPHPLPNLEYRTVCADSLSDFVAGEEVQNTRAQLGSLGFDRLDPSRLIALRDRYFEASHPEEKERLRADLAAEEDDLVEGVFHRARLQAEQAAKAPAAKARKAGAEGLAGLQTLTDAYRGRDRIYPVFLPAFHAPEAVARGGWDVVIMNPPYVGRKEVSRRLSGLRIGDLERHYGRTYDLMLHFGFRALELVRPGGALSMIFNDSIFTSADADDFRRLVLGAGDVTLRAAARTRCFEGVAVNGGVLVATRGLGPEPEVRWVENHGQPVTDLLGASRVGDGLGEMTAVGTSELFEVQSHNFHRLPHRPLFRPSRAALLTLDAFERCAGWEEFGRYEADAGADWSIFSETRRLERWKAQAQAAGWYKRLQPGEDFVLLGLVIDGGQGLATADDRRFIATIEGTPQAETARERQSQLEKLTLEHPVAAVLYEDKRTQGIDMDAALLEVAERFHPQEELGWPRGGEIRIAPADCIRRTRLSEEEIVKGVEGECSWVPFEKTDDSTPAGAAAWRRQNPLAIDWSPNAVALLRQRATQRDSYRKPRLQNQQIWGRAGVSWNRVASYLRVRLNPEGGIFSSEAPTVIPIVDWLTPMGLLALLNASVLDFILRSVLGSRMHIEIGDLRRLPIPVLTTEQSEKLDDLGSCAVKAKEALDEGYDGEPLAAIETELDRYVRDLYCFPRDIALWVVR
jgi:hypothetical protein